MIINCPQRRVRIGQTVTANYIMNVDIIYTHVEPCAASEMSANFHFTVGQSKSWSGCGSFSFGIFCLNHEFFFTHCHYNWCKTTETYLIIKRSSESTMPGTLQSREGMLLWRASTHGKIGQLVMTRINSPPVFGLMWKTVDAGVWTCTCMLAFSGIARAKFLQTKGLRKKNQKHL